MAMQAMHQRRQEERLIRIRELIETTGLSRSMIYLKQNVNSKYYDSGFPRGKKLGVNAVGWLLSEVMDWVESRK